MAVGEVGHIGECAGFEILQHRLNVATIWVGLHQNAI